MKTQDFAPTGEKWIVELRSDVSDGDAWLLLQGYPATGFWVVTDSSVLTPPGWPQQPLDWNLYWDARLFGSEGEWHLWRTGRDQWRGRFCAADEWADFMDREDALWGTQVETTQTPGRRWSRLWEERGVSIWVPFEVKEAGLPLRLRIRRRVDYQPNTGLAGFTDAMILGFVGVQP